MGLPRRMQLKVVPKRQHGMRVFHACFVPVLLCCGVVWGAEQFPAIEGDNLLGQKVNLPEAAKGHPTVLIIGFTHASQNQTKPWTARLTPEFNAYSIAVLEDAPRLVRGMAIHGIKGSVPENERDHFIIVLHGERELKEAAGFDTPDDAYLLLLDSDGTVRWRYHGPFSDSALNDVKTHLADLHPTP